MAWCEGRLPLGSVLYNLSSELAQCLCHDDSTINIVFIIIIIIIDTYNVFKNRTV